MNIQSYKKKSFQECLEQILLLCQISEEIKVKEILLILSGKGYAALLIVLSLPFCIPIQIPGLSTPFGVILAFLGLRIAFAKRPWLPSWILEKNIKTSVVQNLVKKTIQIVKYMQKVLDQRLVFLTQSPVFHRLNGIIIFFLALLLSLPLPVPFTNLLAAIPVLCIGLGLLEDDGVFILIGYFFTLMVTVIIFSLFKLGWAYFQTL